MIVDTHAHLDSHEFENDLPTLVDLALSKGVDLIICPGTSAESSRRVIELARTYQCIKPAVGIHPNYAGQAGPNDWHVIEQLASSCPVTAIGETGLDRHWHFTPWETQKDYFDRHLWLAGRLGLPVIIHCRDAEQDVLDHLRAARQRFPIRGVVHAFSSSPEAAAEFLGLGLYLSFAGSVTYKNRKFQPLRDVARQVPLEKVLVETDSPYLVPEPYRGKLQVNNPTLVWEVASAICKIRGIDVDYFCKITSDNARKLFRLD